MTGPNKLHLVLLSCLILLPGASSRAAQLTPRAASAHAAYGPPSPRAGVSVWALLNSWAGPHAEADDDVFLLRGPLAGCWDETDGGGCGAPAGSGSPAPGRDVSVELLQLLANYGLQPAGGCS